MPNYNNSFIYKLCCKNTEIKQIYIGSTTNFKNRKCDHKTNCNNSKRPHYNLKVYKFIRENGGFENWDMILIKNVNVDSKLQLHKKEREFIEKLKPELNMSLPASSDIEYQESTKKHYSQKRKEHYRQNIEKVKKYQKDNYERIKAQDKERQKIYYNCICGNSVKIRNKSRHEKSKKHMNFC